jgi:hypothetical protein
VDKIVRDGGPACNDKLNMGSNPDIPQKLLSRAT